MHRILVIRLGAIGDLILLSPAVLNLKLSFRQSEIYLMTRQHLVSLAEMMTGVDRVLPFPPDASALDLFRMGEYLDEIGCDLILDMHGNLRSSYLRRHVASTEAFKYPKRRWQRWLAARFQKLNPDAPHTIDLYNAAVEKAGGTVYARRPVLSPPRRPEAAPLFDNKQPVIAVAPGASYPVKQWPPDRFSTLTRLVAERLQANVVLILTDRDRAMLSLRDQLEADRLKIFIDTDLGELTYVVAQSDVIVANDSALAHLGSAMGTPAVALFGPTHPTLGFSPRGLRDRIIQVPEPCRPCSLHGKRACHRDEQYCFTRIDPETVLEAVSDIIEAGGRGTPALFIDRDGTLTVEKGFIGRPDDIEPEAGSIEAVKLARQAGYKIIAVSNQSGVARGYFSENDVRRVNQRVLDIFRDAGAPLDDIFYCPFHKDGRVAPYNRAAVCRKPAPGMTEQAALKHHLDLFRSYTVGDRPSDVHLGHVIGGKGILVRTGYGVEGERELAAAGYPGPETVVDNLLGAVKYITAERPGEA